MKRTATLGLLSLILILSACSQHGTLAPSSTFPEDSEWQNADIGTPDAEEGSIEVLSMSRNRAHPSDLRIRSSGYGARGKRDSFHFGFVPYSGDVQISARIEEPRRSHAGAAAGVMIRNSLNADSMHALVSTTSDGTVEFIIRAETGEEALVQAQLAGSFPIWVSIIRQGSTVTGLTSADGINWTEIGTAAVGFDQNTYVGVGAASRIRQKVREVTISEINVDAAPPVEEPSQPPATDPGTPGDKDPITPPEEPVTPPSGEPQEPPAEIPEEPPVEEPGTPPVTEPQVPPVTEPEEPPVEEPETPPVTEPELPPVTQPGNPPPLGYAGDWVCPSQPLSPAYQPTLFVATNGSDSNDGRSESRPFKTLQQAVKVAAAGDVVWVRGGVYSGQVTFTKSASASNKIVFESYPGECAIIDGSGSSSRQAVRFLDAQNHMFRNFVVRNSTSQGIFMQRAHNNTISNVIIHDSIESGLLTMQGNSNVFTNIISYGNYDPRNPGDSDGLSISSGNGNRISGCIVFDNSDDGVDTWLSTNSVVERCVAFRNGLQGGDGNGIKAGGRNSTSNTIVRNSVSFSNRTNGFDHNTSSNVTFDNNTAFNNGRDGFIISNGTARNNLSFGNKGSNAATYNKNNTYVTNSWNLGITDPGFASTSDSNRDFLRLRDNSPAIAAGTNIGLPYSGRAPDLGALPHGRTIADQLGIALTNAGTYQASR